MKANQEASTAIRTRSIIVISKAVLLLSVAAGLAAESLEGRQPSKLIPGVVIDHSPAASGLYIGSPSIAILTNGDFGGGLTSNLISDCEAGITWSE